MVKNVMSFILTTVDFIQFPIYTALDVPSQVCPPNIKNVSLVSDVRVKLSQGGGQSPLTISEIH